MAPNRIMRGSIVRRPLLAGALAGLLAAALSACGGGGSSTATAKERDVKVLNQILGRQLAVAAAYGRLLQKLHGADLAVAQQFLAQEQEHVHATTKTLRGMGRNPAQ